MNSVINKISYHLRRRRFRDLNAAEFDGPYFIIHAGHAGSRLLAELFHRQGIQMGNINNENFDTEYFAPTKANIAGLTIDAFYAPELSPAQLQQLKLRTEKLVREYIYHEIRDPRKPFGWKFSASSVFAPLVLEQFPNAKCIHLIRDGRDVILSKMDARMKNLDTDTVNKILVFGDPRKNEFLGETVNKESVEKHRLAYEMQYWVTSVESGLRASVFKERYVEIRYEELVLDTDNALAALFNFLVMELKEECMHWIKTKVDSSKIGRWRKYKQEELDDALKIGEDVLRKMQYLT